MIYNGACLVAVHAPFYLCYVIMSYVMSYDAMMCIHLMSITPCCKWKWNTMDVMCYVLTCKAMWWLACIHDAYMYSIINEKKNNDVNVML